MGLVKKMTKTALIGGFLIPLIANANVTITEIVYNLEGSDTKKEWVEICNLINKETDITGWKFNDGSNHILNVPPENGGQGSLVMSPQECTILTGDAETFLNLHTGYSGTVIDTVMSLNNTEDTLLILDGDSLEIDSVTYNKEMGASGDGNSLQKTNSGWVASTPTPGISDLVEEIEETPAETTSTTTETVINNIIAPKQTIFADAGSDKTVIVGADALFEGKAYGLEGEVLENANYIWNFGDGTIKKEKKVLHAYSYPGKYVVFFDASSGKYSNSDRINVTALPADIIVSNIKFGMDGFIELHNKTDRELDLSWWRLSIGNNFFTIPKNTFILPNNKIIFSSNNTGLIINNNNVQLLYPNGSLANKYKKGIIIKSNEIVKPTDNNSLNYVSTEPKKSSVKSKTETASSSKITASVIDSISKDDGSSGSIYKWILAISSIILIAVISIVFKKTPSNSDLSAESDEIEII